MKGPMERGIIEGVEKFAPESLPQLYEELGLKPPEEEKEQLEVLEPSPSVENIHGIFAGPIKVPVPNGFSRDHLQDVNKNYSVRYHRRLEGEDYCEVHFMHFDHKSAQEAWEKIADIILSSAEEEPKLVNGWSILYMSKHPFKKELKGHYYYSLYSSTDFSFMTHMSAPSNISKEGLEQLLVNYLDEHIKPQIRFEEYSPSKK